MYVGKEKSKEEPNVNLQKLYSRIYDDLETKPSNYQTRLVHFTNMKFETIEPFKIYIMMN
jgi:hypothetical protein